MEEDGEEACISMISKSGVMEKQYTNMNAFNTHPERPENFKSNIERSYSLEKKETLG